MLDVVYLATRAVLRVTDALLPTLAADVRQARGGFGKYCRYQIDAIRGIETVKAMAAEGALRELMLGQFHGVVAAGSCRAHVHS